MQQVSRGELQITEKDIIYFTPGNEPIRWPLKYIRKYGYKVELGAFVFECGRRSETGEAVYAFRVDRVEDLLNRLKEKIDKYPSMEGLSRSDLCSQAVQTIGATNQRVPGSPKSTDDGGRRDASTSTMKGVQSLSTNPFRTQQDKPHSDPLSYTSIDFDTTKALNESAQAHAANRVK